VVVLEKIAGFQRLAVGLMEHIAAATGANEEGEEERPNSS
jgi:hypothetical protein